MTAKIQLRLPQELRDWLAAYAEENQRSMNSQLIVLLKDLKRGSEKERAHG